MCLPYRAGAVDTCAGPSNSGSCLIAIGGREVDQAQCEASVGTWNVCTGAACCSDASSTNKATCEDVPAQWTDMICSDGTYTTQASCITQGTWTGTACRLTSGGRELSNATCTATAGVWSGGACNNDAYTTESACVATGLWNVDTACASSANTVDGGAASIDAARAACEATSSNSGANDGPCIYTPAAVEILERCSTYENMDASMPVDTNCHVSDIIFVHLLQ